MPPVHSTEAWVLSSAHRRSRMGAPSGLLPTNIFHSLPIILLFSLMSVSFMPSAVNYPAALSPSAQLVAFARAEAADAATSPPALGIDAKEEGEGGGDDEGDFAFTSRSSFQSRGAGAVNSKKEELAHSSVEESAATSSSSQHQHTAADDLASLVLEPAADDSGLFIAKTEAAPQSSGGDETPNSGLPSVLGTEVWTADEIASHEAAQKEAAADLLQSLMAAAAGGKGAAGGDGGGASAPFSLRFTTAPDGSLVLDTGGDNSGLAALFGNGGARIIVNGVDANGGAATILSLGGGGDRFEGGGALQILSDDEGGEGRTSEDDGEADEGEGASGDVSATESGGNDPSSTSSNDEGGHGGTSALAGVLSSLGYSEEEIAALVGGSNANGDGIVNSGRLADLLAGGPAAAAAAADGVGGDGNDVHTEIEFVGPDGEVLSAEEVAQLTKEGARVEVIEQTIDARGAGTEAIAARIAEVMSGHRQRMEQERAAAEQHDGGANTNQEEESPMKGKGAAKKKKKEQRFRNPRFEAARREMNAAIAKAHAEQDDDEGPFEEHVDKSSSPSSKDGSASSSAKAFIKGLPIGRAMDRYAKRERLQTKKKGHHLSVAAALALYEEEFEAHMAADSAAAKGTAAASSPQPAAGSGGDGAEALLSSVRRDECLARLQRTHRIVRLTLSASYSASDAVVLVGGAAEEKKVSDEAPLTLINPRPASHAPLAARLWRRLRADLRHSDCGGLDGSSDLSAADERIAKVRAAIEASLTPKAKTSGAALTAATIRRPHPHPFLMSSAANVYMCNHFFALSDATAAYAIYHAGGRCGLLRGRVPGIAAKAVATSKVTTAAMASIVFDPTADGVPIADCAADADANDEGVSCECGGEGSSESPFVTSAALRQFVFSEAYLHACPQVTSVVSATAVGDSSSHRHAAMAFFAKDAAYRRFVESVIGELHFFASVLVLEGVTSSHTEEDAEGLSSSPSFDSAEASALAYLRLRQGSAGSLLISGDKAFLGPSEGGAQSIPLARPLSPRGGGVNKASTLALANLHDSSVNSDAKNSGNGEVSGHATLMAAASVAPQSCVGLTSNVYKEARLRRTVLGAVPPPLIIPTSSSSPPIRGNDADDAFAASLALFAAGAGSGEAFARASRISRGFDVRALGTEDSVRTLARRIGLVNHWLGGAAVTTASWVREIGAPLWGRIAHEAQLLVPRTEEEAAMAKEHRSALDSSSSEENEAGEESEKSDVEELSFVRTARLIDAAVSAACASAGCSLAALQDYLVTAVAMLRPSPASPQQHTADGEADSLPLPTAVAPLVTVRTNYIDSLAQLIYPLTPTDTLPSTFSSSQPLSPSQSPSHAVAVLQQSLALAAIDGGFYDDSDLRSLIQEGGPVASDYADDEGDAYAGDDEGHGGEGGGPHGGEPDFPAPLDLGGDEGAEAAAEEATARAERARTIAEGSDRAETLVGSLAVDGTLPMPSAAEAEAYLTGSGLDHSDDGGGDGGEVAFAPLSEADRAAFAAFAAAPPPRVAAFARRATASEEFAAHYARMEAVLRGQARHALMGAAALSMGGGGAPSDGNDAYIDQKVSTSSSSSSSASPLPPAAVRDGAAALREEYVYAFVREAVRYDLTTDTFLGVPMGAHAEQGALGAADTGATFSSSDKKATDGTPSPSSASTPSPNAAAVRELLAELQGASGRPLSAMPSLDSAAASAQSSLLPTDAADIDVASLIGVASAYAGGGTDHLPKDMDRAMCLAAAALSHMGYDDDQRTVLTRVTYGEVKGANGATAAAGGSGGSGAASRRMAAGTVRDAVFYVEKEIISAEDAAMGGAGASSGLHAVHDAIVGVALRQPIPRSAEEALQRAAYDPYADEGNSDGNGPRGGRGGSSVLSAMASEPLDLGIHCRHRDILHWRLVDTIAAEREVYRRREQFWRATVLHRTNGIAAPVIAAAVNGPLYTPAAATDAAKAESLAGIVAGQRADAVAEAEAAEAVASAGLTGELFSAEDHVFMGKHGRLTASNLASAAAAKAIIMVANLEIAASMRAPQYKEEEEKEEEGHRNIDLEAPLSLPVARALYYGLSCMTLQAYAIEAHASYYALLNASTVGGATVSGMPKGKRSAALGASDSIDEEALHSPPPVPTVVAECAPLLASLFSNEALLPNSAIAAIVDRLRRTEEAATLAAAAAAEEGMQCGVPPNPHNGEGGAESSDEADDAFDRPAEATRVGRAPFGDGDAEEVGMPEEEDGGEDGDVADGLDGPAPPQPFVNIFEEYEEDARREAAEADAKAFGDHPMRGGSSTAPRYSRHIGGQEDHHLQSFADDHLFVHVPHWNLCMRRAVEAEALLAQQRGDAAIAAKKKNRGGASKVAIDSGANSGGDAEGPSPISVCRRQIAYHLYALAAAAADFSPRNLSSRTSAEGAIRAAVAAYTAGRNRREKAPGSGTGAANGRRLWAEAAAEAAAEDVWTGGLPQLESHRTPYGDDSNPLSEPARPARGYVGSDVWIRDELRNRETNNSPDVDGGAGSRRSRLRLLGAYPMAAMHAQAARDPWWLPPLSEADDDGGDASPSFSSSLSLPYVFDLSESAMYTVDYTPEEGSAPPLPRPMRRHAATRHETSPVGARLFIAAPEPLDADGTAAETDAPGSSETAPSSSPLAYAYGAPSLKAARAAAFSALTAKAVWAPTAGALAERRLKQATTTASSSASSPNALQQMPPLHSAQQFYARLSYYHTVIEGVFDPFQALTSYEDGAFAAADTSNNNPSSTHDVKNGIARPTALQRGRLGLSKGNIFDLQYPRAPSMAEGPNADDAAEWVFSDGGSGATARTADGPPIAAAGADEAQRREFFFLNFDGDGDGDGAADATTAQTEGSPTASPSTSTSSATYPTRDYTHSGRWTRPDAASEDHVAIAGADDEAAAVSLLLTAHGHPPAAALLSGLATGPAADVAPATHADNPFAATVVPSLALAEQQESACRLGDAGAHRLYAESARPVSSGGRRYLPDYEHGGAGGTRPATAAKFFARTRLGEAARRDALFMLSDYAVAGHGEEEEGGTTTITAMGSNATATSVSGGAASPQHHSSHVWQRFVMLPTAVLFVAVDAAILSPLRTVLAILRGSYLCAAYVWDSVVMRQWLWHTRVPSFSAAAGAGEGTASEREALVRFFAAAGITPPPQLLFGPSSLASALPKKGDSASAASKAAPQRLSRAQREGLLRQAFGVHMDAFLGLKYDGLLRSVANERAVKRLQQNSPLIAEELDSSPPAFSDLSLLVVARRAFSLSNVAQPSALWRSAAWPPRLAWLAGDELSADEYAFGFHTDSRSNGDALGPRPFAVSSCAARDTLIRLSQLPRPMVVSTAAPNGPAVSLVAAEAGAIHDMCLAPLLETIGALLGLSGGAHSVPLLGRGGWAWSLLTATSDAVASALSPSPLCDDYADALTAASAADVSKPSEVKSHPTRDAHVTTANDSNAPTGNAFSSIASLRPAERFLANNFLRRVLLLDGSSSSPSTPPSSLTSGEGEGGDIFTPPTPSPIVPTSERRRSVRHASAMADALVGIGLVGASEGLGRPEHAGAWLGDGGHTLMSAAGGLSVADPFAAAQIGAFDNNHHQLWRSPAALHVLHTAAEGAEEEPRGLVSSLLLSSLGEVVTGAFSTATQIGRLAFFSESVFWGSINSEVFGWRWAVSGAFLRTPLPAHGGTTCAATADGEEGHRCTASAAIIAAATAVSDAHVAANYHRRALVAVPHGPNTAPSGPVALERFWVGAGRAMTDSDAADAPIYWPHVGLSSLHRFGSAASPAERQWGAASGSGGGSAAKPIADFVLSRYRPIVEARAGFVVDKLRKAKSTAGPSSTANNAVSARVVSAMPVGAKHYDGALMNGLLSLEQTSALLTSGGPEESTALLRRRGSAPNTRKHEATAHLALPSAAFANAAERDMWRHLGQYDVVALLPSRDTMELETGTSALFACHSSAAEGDATPSVATFSSLPHVGSVSHAPRDAALSAVYAAHRHAAASALAAFSESMASYASRHSGDAPAAEHLLVEAEAKECAAATDPSCAAESSLLPFSHRRLRVTLRTPFGATNGADPVEWARGAMAEALAAHNVTVTLPPLFSSSSRTTAVPVASLTGAIGVPPHAFAALHRPSFLQRTVDTMYSALGALLGSQGFATARRLLFAADVVADGAAMLRTATVTATVTLPPISMAGQPGGDVEAVSVNVSEAFALHSSSEPVDVEIRPDEALASAAERAQAAFAHLWACSGLGTALLYTGRAPTAPIGGAEESSDAPLGLSAEAAAALGLFLPTPLTTTSLPNEAFAFDGAKSTTYWDPSALAAELRRYADAAAMRSPSSSPRSAGGSPRSPFADASFLPGDGQCLADMAWLLRSGAGPLIFGGGGGSSKDDGLSLLAIEATYEARRVRGADDGAEGTDSSGPLQQWHLQRIRLVRPPVRVRHAEGFAAAAPLLSALSVSVLRGRQRYEGTARYAAGTPSGRSAIPSLLGEEEEGAGDFVATEGADGDGSPSVKVAAEALVGFAPPRHGLYADGAATRPRPLFTDAAAADAETSTSSSKRHPNAANGVQSLATVDVTDPFTARYRGSAARSPIAYPPYSSAVALASAEVVAEAERSNAHATAAAAPAAPSPLPRVAAADEGADGLRAAPPPWPPRLGEGRSFFGGESVLSKQTADGAVTAAEWLQWAEAAVGRMFVF